MSADVAGACLAKDAGLRHSSHRRAGISRRHAGRGFRYLGTDGSAFRDAATLDRIRRLAVPPAWTDVWICPDPFGHLQATGRDARGRKQYRYDARWRTVRDAAKFDAAARTSRARSSSSTWTATANP